MNRVALIPACVLSLACGIAAAQEKTYRVVISAGKHDYRNVPVCVPLQIPKEQGSGLVNWKGGVPGPAQLTYPSIVTEAIKAETGMIRRDLHFLVPELKAGASVTVSFALMRADAAAGGESDGFEWFEEKGKHWELRHSQGSRKSRPILRYMCPTFDDSSKENRNKTYKVFHHVYDPDGKRFVTNGGHTDPFKSEKELLYPHHRGLMFAFNRITYGPGKQADTWHCTGDAHQSHKGTLGEEAGLVLGRHRVAVAWHGVKKEVFATEEREMTVYNIPGGTLVEFASRLKTAGGKVKLDGDPQHAGFQFRAANQVAEKTARQTYYLRPDGKGELGATRNWDPKTRTGTVDLPWNAMSFVLGEQRYTVCYLDHPKNPGEKRYSERDYGRFGCYFEHELTEDHPLVLNHRVWLQNGEMTGEQVQALSAAFTTPPQVTVK